MKRIAAILIRVTDSVMGSSTCHLRRLKSSSSQPLFPKGDSWPMTHRKSLLLCNTARIST